MYICVWLLLTTNDLNTSERILIVHGGKNMNRVVFAFFIVGLLIATSGCQNEYKTLEKNVPPVTGIEKANLILTYGAGVIKVSKGTGSNFLYTQIKTHDKDDPVLNSEIHANTIDISLARLSSNHNFVNLGSKEDDWNVQLSPAIEYSINMKYGAADSNINLIGLSCSAVSIQSGASNMVVKFAEYPTQANIETGASSIKLDFPRNYGAMVIVDGMVSTSLNDFRKDGNNYYSPTYNETGKNILVHIKAGASRITGEMY